MKNTIKWTLFISSYIPLFIILIFTNINFDITFKSINNILLGNFDIVLQKIDFKDIYLWILVSLCFICLALVKTLITQSKGFEVNKKIIEIEYNNNSVLEYFATYLLALSSSELSFNGVIIFWFTLYIIGHLYIKNNNFYINPTLYLIFKYNIYKVKTEDNTECFVLSKLNEYEFNSYLNKNIEITPLSESFKGSIYLFR